MWGNGNVLGQFALSVFIFGNRCLLLFFFSILLWLAGLLKDFKRGSLNLVVPSALSPVPFCNFCILISVSKWTICFSRFICAADSSLEQSVIMSLNTFICGFISPKWKSAVGLSFEVVKMNCHTSSGPLLKIECFVENGIF